MTDDVRAEDDETRTRLLERDGWTVRLDPAGTGPSGYHDLTVTTGWAYPERHGGVAIYVRDTESGRSWPAALHPDGRLPDRYHAWLERAAPRLAREDDRIETVTDITLASGPVELRRVTLTNTGDTRRSLEVTSCVPVALDTPAAYGAHPAFSKLFLQTEYLPDLQGLLARRRPRSPDDPPLSAVHLLVPDRADGPPTFETDRARFLGRGRSAGRPRALDPDAPPLSGTTGRVLDPVLALRRTVTLEPGASAAFTAVLTAGRDPKDARTGLVYVAAPADIRRAFEEDQGAPAGPDHGEALLTALRAARSPSDREEGEGVGGSSDPDDARPAVLPDREELRFFNGFGGFSADGREYVIRLGTGRDLRRPPLPWINVIANPQVGFLASETGAGYTWVGNSRLNRLTPWYNDPVTDPHGEAVYLRDEASGAFWSPMPGPRPGRGEYETRHGFGYTRYRHMSSGLEQDVWQAVAADDPVKLVRVRVTNRSDRVRTLTVWGYFEWVLGGGAEARRRVWAAPDPGTGAILARNPGTEDHEQAVAFAAPVGPAGAAAGATAHRGDLLGSGSVASPAAVRSGVRPEPREARGDDACAGAWVELSIEPGETAECAFVLGQTGGMDDARALVRQYGDIDAVAGALAEVRARWESLVGRVQVETPLPELDVMVNGWLAYQDLSCRIHGRSALYQSGGAFGYRDQLQDVTGLIHLDPELARDQIVLHAGHQFPEGDVLHWWHPPADRGIRTRFSDDLLWLPYVTGFYLDVTGDASVLEESAAFVDGRLLGPDEDEVYMSPEPTGRTATVYEHGCRAIDRSLTRGRHGLPLMGTGDWNDGMNRVGREGEGESVWLGFFLADILGTWIPLCEDRRDTDRAERYRAYLSDLVRALNAEDGGWDGAWYRRAYYDNGAPIGSSESDECRIDAIAQAWSVLSGVAPRDRAEQALDSLEEHLVDDEHGLIRLLTPPFDETPHDPGYIKGYLPGVRENGGQYTHGVLWAVRAMARLGRTDRAAELLQMLLPTAHARTPEAVDRYRVEPYVVAADIYGAEPHVGRGGWTWYTGSAGWLYRIALESLLGLRMEAGRRLRLRPALPSSWQGYRIRYTDPRGTRWDIDVRRGSGGPTTASVDGEPASVEDGEVVLPLDGEGDTRAVHVEAGADARPRYTPLAAMTSA